MEKLASTLWRILRERVQLVSPGEIELEDRERGYGTGVHVRDPDGHALPLVSQ